jgi:hypothetical protein
MKIEIIHPINHDNVEYACGIQDVPDAIGGILLKYPWAAKAVSEAKPAKTTEE